LLDPARSDDEHRPEHRVGKFGFAHTVWIIGGLPPGQYKVAKKRRNMIASVQMSELRACTVSYRDNNGLKHSVEVMAESLYEAIGLAQRVFKLWSLHHFSFEVMVKQPEVRHEVSGAIFAAWLARKGKTPKEEELKQRLREVAHHPSP
jgi:hypothetical protein